MLQLTYTIIYTITTITTMYYYFYYKILNSVEKKFRKAAHISVAAVREPVFLKTDHCASNKNVKFSKVFTYIALILTFFGKKEFLNFTEN